VQKLAAIVSMQRQTQPQNSSIICLYEKTKAQPNNNSVLNTSTTKKTSGFISIKMLLSWVPREQHTKAKISLRLVLNKNGSFVFCKSDTIWKRDT